MIEGAFTVSGMMAGGSLRFPAGVGLLVLRSRFPPYMTEKPDDNFNQLPQTKRHGNQAYNHHSHDRISKSIKRSRCHNVSPNKIALDFSSCACSCFE
jgi:hypothetical protein